MPHDNFHFDNSYCRLPQALYSSQSPSPVAAPELRLLNAALATQLALNTDNLQQAGADWFSGNRPIPDAEPIAQAYAGHQFGHPTMLGDGRAVLLGEHLLADGTRYDIVLKGAGRTVFSRGGDGRAALGPMLREYLISESMAALGIPSSRSLALVTTGETIARDTPQQGAILTRVAASHIRVGTFQYAAWRKQPGLLESLMQYTIERHYPALKNASNPALALLEAVMDKQIALVVHWMRVGFIHGVMNTDNVTLSGETIDYGPCAFMDQYDPLTVFSSIDRQGRYAYGRQPAITQWNLERFAETLLPLIDENSDAAVQQATAILESFMPKFGEAWQRMMLAKIGIEVADQKPPEAAVQLVEDLLQWMQENRADYTNTFYALSQQEIPAGEIYQQPAFTGWFQRWQQWLSEKGQQAHAEVVMQQNNPAVIPRNHRVNQVLMAAEKGDFSPFNALLDVLQTPYIEPDDNSLMQLPVSEEEVTQTFCGT